MSRTSLRCAFLVLGLQAATAALGQAPVYAALTITPKLEAVTWNSSLHSQYANFSISCGYSAPTGMAIDSYTWAASGMTLAATNTTSASNSGYMTGTGQAYVHVSVTCHYTAYPTQHVTFEGWNDEYCAAFGGPIGFSPTGGSVPTWSWDNDTQGNDWYAEYFMPLGTTLGPYDQSPQNMLVSVSSAQPGTTLVTWSIGSMSAGTSPTSGVAPGSLTLKASTTGNSTIGASYSVTWVDPSGRQSGNAGTDTSSGSDDTSSTQDKNSAGTWITRSNVIDCHQPKTLTWSADASGEYPSPLPSGTTGWETDYLLTLTDSSGSDMPDVWFNEHFTTALPPNFVVNTTSVYWQTGDTSPYIGIANGYDVISYNWGTNQASWVDYYPIHSYYAATHAIDGLHGINVGTADISLIYGDPNNSPTPADASQ